MPVVINQISIQWLLWYQNFILDRYNVNTSNFNNSVLRYNDYESVDNIAGKGFDFDSLFANISVEDKTSYPLLFDYYQNNGSINDIFYAYARVSTWGDFNLDKEPWSDVASYPSISSNQVLRDEFDSFINNVYDDKPCRFTLYRKFINEYTESKIVEDYNNYLVSIGQSSSSYPIGSFLYNWSNLNL